MRALGTQARTSEPSSKLCYTVIDRKPSETVRLGDMELGIRTLDLSAVWTSGDDA
jgi:hypothetical protein